MNNYFIMINQSYSSFNILLANNLNKYHPGLFYTSLITSFLLVVSILTGLSPNYQLFKYTYIINYSFKWNYLSLFSNLTALFMGSWWALQEGTWGGWWNWDPSEVFGLLVMINGLLFIHQSNSHIFYTKSGLKLNALLFISLFFYFFIQLNFDLVSHNFGSKFFFFFSNNLFYLEALFFLSYGLLYWFSRWYHQTAQILTLTRPQQTLSVLSGIPSWVLFISLISTILLSFIPLINYFLWNYFYINSFNLTSSYDLLVISLLIFLLLTFVNKFSNITLLVTTLLTPFTLTTVSLFPLLTLKFSSKLHVIHTIIVSFLTINLITNTSSFIYWCGSTESANLLFSTQLYYNYNTVFVCDNTFIEFHNLFYTYNNHPILSSTVVYNSSTPTIHTFLLPFDKTNILNYYTLSDNYLRTHILVELNGTNLLYELLTWGTLMYIIGSKFYYTKLAEY